HQQEPGGDRPPQDTRLHQPRQDEEDEHHERRSDADGLEPRPPRMGNDLLDPIEKAHSPSRGAATGCWSSTETFCLHEVTPCSRFRPSAARLFCTGPTSRCPVVYRAHVAEGG